MYQLIAYDQVSKNFTAHFGPDISLSPYFDRISSNKSGKLEFIGHKFVKYLMRHKGYEDSAHESLQSFICRKYSESAWNFLKKLM